MSPEFAWQLLPWEQKSSLIATTVSQQDAVHDDQPVRRFRLRNNGRPESVQLVASIEPSLLNNDFEAEVKVHTTLPGIRVGLLIALPHQIDPRTRKPMLSVLQGEAVKEPETWQTLRIVATEKAVEAQLRRIRAELNRSDIRTQDALILGMVLVADAAPEESFIDIGEARFGPTLKPANDLLQLIRDSLSDRQEIAQQREFIPLDLELDAIVLESKPVILRLAPDHGEDLELLKSLGLNAVWVSDFEAVDRARDLRSSRLAVLATPPHPGFAAGHFSQAEQVLSPLDQLCPNVSAWYYGTRVTADDLPHLLAWSREVRSADRVFQRLHMADVTGSEGAFAREIDLVGVGRHVVGRDESFGTLRNLLIRRQKSAGQLSFPWMWVQTMPSSTQTAWRTALDLRLPVVEPEQIQHQIYGALSAGYKGVGFWKTRALDPQNPIDREMAIAIELACMEIDLLEPFLARGRIEGHLQLRTPDHREQIPAKSVSKSRPLLSRALGGPTAGVPVSATEAPSGHDAAVISGGATTLILATAWDSVSQFVPGPMFEKEVDLIVAASETASAWQLSTSGIRSLPRDIMAGGLSLRIQEFDRSAALVVSSDPDLIRTLEQKIHAMSEHSATLLRELASLKYTRVLETIDELREVHSVPAGADELMKLARRQLERAEVELNSRDYSEAATWSRDSLRTIRLTQQACWKDATAELTGPTASPHAISFSTLPDHWRLMHYLDKQSFRLTEDLLQSGSFEGEGRVLSGWAREVSARPVFSASADVVSDTRFGKVLRLVTWQTDPAASRTLKDDVTPLIITTPAIPVIKGDVIVVSGRVRKGRTSSANLNTGGASFRPLVIFDSELGPECGLRVEPDLEWQDFEMYRPIGESSEFSVSMGLTGQAEIHIDDLQIRKLPSLPGVGSNSAQITGPETPGLEETGADP
ncbi:MAG: hypothetical protein ACK58L_20870 [Planctomycetota bacterium]